MSIQSITQQVQDTEQYRIRSSKSLQAQQAQSVSTPQQAAPQTDEYDKANPVGESVEGIYSVSHDDEGNLKVNYTQPAEKSSQIEAKTESKTEPKAEASRGQNASAGAAPSTTSSTSESDNELEELKKQEEQLKAQLNRETDEGTKQALRAQLQSVEMQIAMKSAGVNS